MKRDDEVKFYQGLKSLELFFRDTLTEEHELLYWDTMRDICTIDEWEAACFLARQHHDFHTVPLPAIMMRYVDDVRRVMNKQFELEQKLLSQERKQLETAERQQEAKKTNEASLAKLAALWGEDWLAGHKRMLDSLYPDTQKESNE
jgi:hypothetical protein